MKNKNRWIDLSLLNLVTVAFLGLMIRSKALFPMPQIDYNHLLDAHGHFAFCGWVTLALMTLMISELLPASVNNKKIYQWFLAGVSVSAWGMLITFYLTGNSGFSNFFSALFILITYLFGFYFSMDIRKAQLSSAIKLLSVSSVVYLIMSSAGPISLVYLFSVKSLNAILYRDALFTYLHLQYNGFFTLSVFALLFNQLEQRISAVQKGKIKMFSVLLIVSVLPSMFLSYLWHDPNTFFRVMAIAGSVLLMLTLGWFIVVCRSMFNLRKKVSPLIQFLGIVSMTAFMLKVFLQSFTIFTVVGDAVFGDRPIIIGFLHLVFLVFVTLFILAYYTQTGLLNSKKRFTTIALALFSTGVLFNELFQMSQGLGALFIKSSFLFAWFLWGSGIVLFTGAIFIGLARRKSRKTFLQLN